MDVKLLFLFVLLSKREKSGIEVIINVLLLQL